MSRLALLASALVLVAAGSDEKWTNRRCCDKGSPRPWKNYNKIGVTWTQPMEAAAKQAARKTGKLLMVFQLVGDMDKEGC